MRQYLDVKDRYPDGIVFFRLGDFYEMFFEDAVVAAKALDLTLTTRDKGREDAIPMCGVPHHAARGYIGRLTELGHKVVICEQVEDPRVAKGIVRREVTRVVTPGIVLDEDMLDAKAARYLAAATALSRKRRTAARDLEKKVQGELALLAMERTRFQVSFTPDTLTPSAEDTSGWNERGLETAELLLSPNPGEDLRPLARIASGGELSRILLALKSVASLDARGKTLVFDEVDAGIGGRVAEVVGRKLRDIAQRHQVLCVTHLPQIASMADRHLVVRKQIERGRTTTHVALLDPAARVEEVARMLGGETVTDAARRHAREMVKRDFPL